jgi:hypothetical protein
VNDIRDAIAQIRGDLPEGILEPQITASTSPATRSCSSPPRRPT